MNPEPDDELKRDLAAAKSRLHDFLVEEKAVYAEYRAILGGGSHLGRKDPRNARLAQLKSRKGDLKALIRDSREDIRRIIAPLQRDVAARAHSLQYSLGVSRFEPTRSPMRSHISHKLISADDRDDI